MALDWFLPDESVRIGIGVYDGLSTLVAQGGDVDFLWLSSFCVSASLGRPDAGVLDASEMATLVRTVSMTTRHPVVVDMDSGYGDALKVSMATQMIAKSGASAVCIEDNPLVKRSSLYDIDDRELATVDEHEERLRAARDGLVAGCRLIARTEALVAGLGVAEALNRAHRYAEAGADAVFVQATKPDEGQELLEFARKWARRTPVFIAPTRYPALGVEDYTAAGITHWIFANQAIRAAYRAVDSTIRQVEKARTGHAPRLDDQIASVREISDALGARAVGS
jgi:phosphoenolpyruvate phosphomutase